ncbi:hypothetical protein ACQ4PT_040315 [Festuca glaucescens]
MDDHHLLPVAAAIAVALLALRAAGYPTYPFTVCGASSFYKPNSTYQAHLDLAAATVPRNASASPDLFAAAVVGAVPEQLWAMGLCRGDVNATTCFTCLTQAFLDLPNYCSYQKDASIYYDACILHYSDVHVLSSDDNGPQFDMSNIYNLGNVTSDPARYNRLLAALVNDTADYAAYNSTRRFATGEADFDLQPHKVYTVAQCTPDQTPAECRRCLARLIMTSLPAFLNHTGGRTLWFNCTYRFETSPFYNGPAMVRLASRSRGAPAPAVQPTVGTPGVAGGDPRYSTETEVIEMVDSILIDVSTLRAATVNFAESNKLGQGGFGTVYKGALPNGDEIAVKRLSQGGEELKNELALVAKLKHKNLARLVGVCLEQQERLLVYEFVPNRSLDLILFDIEKREQLDWEQSGYMAPEYVARGNYSVKSDAFSFGVIVLEIITGRKNNGCSNSGRSEDLLTMVSTNHDLLSSLLRSVAMMRSGSRLQTDMQVWEHWEAGMVTEIVDPCMGGSFHEGDVLKCFHVGLLCVQGNPAARPMMSSVVTMLGSDTVTLQAPSKPAFLSWNTALIVDGRV